MPTVLEQKESGPVQFNPSGSLMIDLSRPRTISVLGVNPDTGETKNYLLKVTQSGKLLLL